MNNLSDILLEKFRINKDTKINSSDEEPVLLISHSNLSNFDHYVSFYYYEISDSDEDTITLKNHEGKFYILAHTPNTKDKYIYASLEKSDYLGYVILKKDAIRLIEEILQKSILEWKGPKETYKIEKQRGLRRDNITLEEWLKKLLDWFKNGVS